MDRLYDIVEFISTRLWSTPTIEYVLPEQPRVVAGVTLQPRLPGISRRRRVPRFCQVSFACFQERSGCQLIAGNSLSQGHTFC